MRFTTAASRPRLIEPDLTAMVDMTFLLIIFFVTTSSFVKMTRADVELTQAPGEEGPASPTPGLVINVERDGTYIVDSEEVSYARLMDMIAVEVHKAGGDADSLDVVVRADRAAALSFVNQVAQGMIDQGVRSWRLATRVPQLHASGGGAP